MVNQTEQRTGENKSKYAIIISFLENTTLTIEMKVDVRQAKQLFFVSKGCKMKRSCEGALLDTVRLTQRRP